MRLIVDNVENLPPNSPSQHDRAMELDLAYPEIRELTARTVVAFSVEEAVQRSVSLTFPLFVKGSVQSWKSKGWDACVVETVDDLARLVSQILQSQSRTRGKIVMRELLSLRHTRRSGLGFPIGREYRVLWAKEKSDNGAALYSLRSITYVERIARVSPMELR